MAPAPFPSAVQAWHRCCGQQEITEGANPFSDVAAAEPILTPRCCFLGSACRGGSVPGWHLPEGARCSVLLLLMLKVNRFISFILFRRK